MADMDASHPYPYATARASNALVIGDPKSLQGAVLKAMSTCAPAGSLPRISAQSFAAS